HSTFLRAGTARAPAASDIRSLVAVPRCPRPKRISRIFIISFCENTELLILQAVARGLETRNAVTFVLKTNKTVEFIDKELRAGLLAGLGRVAVLFALFALVDNGHGASTNVSIQTIPDWVELREWSVPTNGSHAQNSEGVRNLVY